MLDEFDDFNDKVFYSSSSPSSTINYNRNCNDFPFDNEFSDQIFSKPIEQEEKEEEEEEERDENDDHDDRDDDEGEEYLSNENQLLTNSNKTIEFDPLLANEIINELGLDDPQSVRKNAWGNLSYAELIGKAIRNSSQQRLTLSQIYSWIILYVPYFRDKSDKKSSQGWKNSIRHNLSLHNRFVRIPNEIAGKSSWWTIDFRAKQNRQRKKNQSNENKKKHLFNQQSFTSVRDINQSLYSNINNYHTQTQSSSSSSSSSIQQQHFILHHMLKNNTLQTSYEENDERLNPTELIISEKINDKQTNKIDQSNCQVRRMIFKLMNVQQNKRDQTLSTPPPPSLSNQQQQQQFNSTFDLDIQTILDFQTTNHQYTNFDLHDLPNL